MSMDLDREARTWGGLRVVNGVNYKPGRGKERVTENLCADHLAQVVEEHGLDGPQMPKSHVTPARIGRCDRPHGREE